MSGALFRKCAHSRSSTKRKALWGRQPPNKARCVPGLWITGSKIMGILGRAPKTFRKCIADPNNPLAFQVKPTGLTWLALLTLAYSAFGAARPQACAKMIWWGFNNSVVGLHGSGSSLAIFQLPLQTSRSASLASSLAICRLGGGLIRLLSQLRVAKKARGPRLGYSKIWPGHAAGGVGAAVLLWGSEGQGSFKVVYARVLTHPVGSKSW